MKLKLFLQLLSVLFAAKVVFGVLYLLFGWVVTIGSWVMPSWLIVLAVIVDGYISYQACQFSKGKK